MLVLSSVLNCDSSRHSASNTLLVLTAHKTSFPGMVASQDHVSANRNVVRDLVEIASPAFRNNLTLLG